MSEKDPQYGSLIIAALFIVAFGVALIILSLILSYVAPSLPIAPGLTLEFGDALLTIGLLGIVWDYLVTRKSDMKMRERFEHVEAKLNEVSDRVAIQSLHDALEENSNKWIANMEFNGLSRLMRAHQLRPKILGGSCTITLKNGNESGYREFLIEDTWDVENHLNVEIPLMDKERWIVISEKEFGPQEAQLSYDPSTLAYLVSFDSGNEPVNYGQTRFLVGPDGSKKQLTDLNNKPVLSIELNGAKSNISLDETTDGKLLSSENAHQEYKSQSQITLKRGDRAKVTYVATLLLPETSEKAFVHFFKDYAESYKVTLRFESGKEVVTGRLHSRNVAQHHIEPVIDIGHCTVHIDKSIMPLDSVSFSWKTS